MSHCPGCGDEFSGNQNFCRSCGEDLSQLEAQELDDPSVLVNRAFHSSVTKKRLTETKPGLTTRYLHDQPLIDYLEANEQPHFILAARNNSVSLTGGGAPSKPERSGTGMAMHMITGHRWLTVVANQNGDQQMSIPLSDIRDISIKTGGNRSHKITLSTDSYHVEVPIGNMYDDEDIEAAQQWLRDNTNSDNNQSTAGAEPSKDDSEEAVSANQFNELANPSNHLDADPQGSWVTAERVKKMGDTLDSDENVHYMFKGGTLDVEGASSGESIWGNDRDRKSSLKGIFTAVTDKRVVINIPQFLGDDERHIPYSSIVSCDLDTGLMARRVSLQTKGPTYHIQAQGPDKDELRTALRFIRDKAEEANTLSVEGVGSGPDPTEQLKNIKELHEQGVLTDEEFEEKKQSLLDKI